MFLQFCWTFQECLHATARLFKIHAQKGPVCFNWRVSPFGVHFSYRDCPSISPLPIIYLLLNYLIKFSCLHFIDLSVDLNFYIFELGTDSSPFVSIIIYTIAHSSVRYARDSIWGAGAVNTLLLLLITTYSGVNNDLRKIVVCCQAQSQSGSNQVWLRCALISLQDPPGKV